MQLFQEEKKQYQKESMYINFMGKMRESIQDFHKKKTPSGLCIPCCYSNWSTPEVKNRRDICQGKFDEKKAEKVSKKEENLKNNYVGI